MKNRHFKQITAILIAYFASSTIWYPAMGYRYGSGLNTVSSYGYYWSATPTSFTGGYYLLFYSTSVLPSYTYIRSYGFSARCVAE